MRIEGLKVCSGPNLIHQPCSSYCHGVKRYHFVAQNGNTAIEAIRSGPDHHLALLNRLRGCKRPFQKIFLLDATVIGSSPRGPIGKLPGACEDQRPWLSCCTEIIRNHTKNYEKLRKSAAVLIGSTHLQALRCCDQRINTTSLTVIINVDIPRSGANLSPSAPLSIIRSLPQHHGRCVLLHPFDSLTHLHSNDIYQIRCISPVINSITVILSLIQLKFVLPNRNILHYNYRSSKLVYTARKGSTGDNLCKKKSSLPASCSISFRTKIRNQTVSKEYVCAYTNLTKEDTVQAVCGSPLQHYNTPQSLRDAHHSSNTLIPKHDIVA